MPLPPDSKYNVEPKIQEYTNTELLEELAKYRRRLATVWRQPALKFGLAVGSGRLAPDQVGWPEVNSRK